MHWSKPISSKEEEKNHSQELSFSETTTAKGFSVVKI